MRVLTIESPSYCPVERIEAIVSVMVGNIIMLIFIMSIFGQNASVF
jgi:hypothetical protein